MNAPLKTAGRPRRSGHDRTGSPLACQHHVSDLATDSRLEQVLATEDEIVSLREQIVRESAARFRESTITVAEYVDRQTDLLAARIARSLHRVELAQARAAYLTTLGLEVR